MPGSDRKRRFRFPLLLAGSGSATRVTRLLPFLTLGRGDAADQGRLRPCTVAAGIRAQSEGLGLWGRGDCLHRAGCLGEVDAGPGDQVVAGSGVPGGGAPPEETAVSMADAAAQSGAASGSVAGAALADERPAGHRPRRWRAEGGTAVSSADGDAGLGPTGLGGAAASHGGERPDRVV